MPPHVNFMHQCHNRCLSTVRIYACVVTGRRLDEKAEGYNTFRSQILTPYHAFFLRSGEGIVVALKSVLRSIYGSNSSCLAGWQIVLMNVLLVNTHHVTLIHFQVTENGLALVVSW